MSERAAGLDDIRAKIDAIDEAMHRLLMERGGLIASLQAAKGVGGPGGSAAMRPAREARMMRALAARHDGSLPLAAVERIWREIIGSFTQMQAPFHVLLTGADKVTLAEFGHYYFSATTPLSYARDAAEVLNAIAADVGAVGVILDDGDDVPWWALLARNEDNPGRAVARLPFLQGPGGEATWQRGATVLSQASVEPTGDDLTLAAIVMDAGADPATAGGTLAEALGAAPRPGLRLAGTHVDGQGVICLMEISTHIAAKRLQAPAANVRWLGGYARPLNLATMTGSQTDG